MAPTNNPTIGQKVTPPNPPTTESHSHGEIDPSSLAASSLRSNGAFSANTGASPGDEPASNPDARPPGSKKQPQTGLEGQESYGGAAPTYVNSQFMVYEGGPRGKNLSEGGFSGSGTEGKMPEPGSKEDPGRAALKGFMGEGGQGLKGEKGQFGALKPEEA
ncbi:hypothetical protein QBC34DRAFT_466446 [Podospora aff. communis PSN243]|uniref:Uncharacterized protein n=1 Tax=Podospora aff. communis PSN243 TaxID=3040156 RepID=A0AAV9GID0_9PEZI|nr:hypothetical protein QBC34DRAFT_466446 [Podospora aff. communis PSN243]